MCRCSDSSVDPTCFPFGNCDIWSFNNVKPTHPERVENHIEQFILQWIDWVYIWWRWNDLSPVHLRQRLANDYSKLLSSPCRCESEHNVDFTDNLFTWGLVPHRMYMWGMMLQTRGITLSAVISLCYNISSVLNVQRQLPHSSDRLAQGRNPLYLRVLSMNVMLADRLCHCVIILITAGVDEPLSPACQKFTWNEFISVF